MPTIRVAFAIACVLTVAVWRSQAFLFSRPADASAPRFGGLESHAARVEIFETGPSPTEAEKPSLLDARAFDGPANATAPRGGFDNESNSNASAAVFSRSLSFHVCNGFANQRLSIVYAAIIAKETRRSLCLPRLLLDGTQDDTSKETISLNSNVTNFGSF